MKPKYIILHHSLTKDGSTVSWAAIRRYHTLDLGWRDVGYHFGIERVGSEYEVFVGRMLDEGGAHCVGMNQKSLGICFVGNFDKHKVPTIQWVEGVRLVRSLMNVFDIPKINVLGHRDIGKHKSCPGKNFSMEDFRQELHMLD
jgi:N-acetyl-anhydromuramyl-L-alanine amidase AmpD